MKPKGIRKIGLQNQDPTDKKSMVIYGGKRFDTANIETVISTHTPESITASLATVLSYS